MGDTSIQWTDKTWNPVTGCTKVSPGCKKCYAERVFPRTVPGQCRCGHKDADHNHGESEFDGLEECGLCDCRAFRQRVFTDVRTHSDRLEQPLHWRKPSRIFVNSMSDLFHEDVPFEFIDRVFGVMNAARHHTFQILTKRPERMREYLAQLPDALIGRIDEWSCALTDSPCMVADEWPLPNVWLGVSAEDQKRADERIPELLQTPAAKRFVSYEPALGPIDFGVPWPSSWKRPTDDLSDGIDALRIQNRPHLDWIIVGGESGPGARPMQLEWARSVRDQCRVAGTAFFFKQYGRSPMVGDSLFALDLDRNHGGDMIEWAEEDRVREFPI